MCRRVRWTNRRAERSPLPHSAPVLVPSLLGQAFPVPGPMKAPHSDAVSFSPKSDCLGPVYLKSHDDNQWLTSYHVPGPEGMSFPYIKVISLKAKNLSI